MTVQLAPIIADQSSAGPAFDDWVLPISLGEPGRMLESQVQWAERGPLRGFFDGLLFDREELARSVDRPKPDCSDADLILHAYERRGEALWSRLRGSFVVALVDRTRGVAIVARDPLGSYPLFYAETGSSVLFAASPRSLLRVQGISRAFNRAAIADHLCLRWPDPQETFFTGVRRVPPGWMAVIAGGRLRLQRYWDPAPEDAPIQWLTAEEIARFDELLDQAIDRCLGSGSTGIFLSGGLDSISVAAVATARAPRSGAKPPLALSLGFSDPVCDERAVQTAVARDLGLRQHLFGWDEAVGSRPLLEQALELNSALSAPILNTWMPAYLRLAQRAKHEGVDTILTGQGGDEWLTVTAYHAADLIAKGAMIELSRFLRTLTRSYAQPPLAVVGRAFWKFGLRPLASRALDQVMPNAHKASRLKRVLAGDPAWVSPDPALRAEQQRRAEIALTRSVSKQEFQGFYARELRTALDHVLPAWESEERHQLGQRIGVRFLHPFLDPDLVAMLYRVPPQILNQGGRSKGLVRSALAKRFPALGFDRQRKVWGTPFYQTLIMREGPALANAAVDFPALSRLGIVEGRRASAAVSEGLKQRSKWLVRFFHLLNAEMWVRDHSDGN